MSGRRRQGLSPTLFPFLAVLICTLGTLILLLALVAENATDTVEQQVAEQEDSQRDDSRSVRAVQLSAETVESMIEAEKFRVEKLVSFRESQTDDLEQHRDRLTHLESHIRRIREELKRLSDEVETATADAESQDVPQTADLVMLRQQLEAEKKTLEELKADAGDQSPRVVIVPHEGPNGTQRRPIYLECTADGLTIWPEGSKISPVQLQDTTPSANPLDAALRVIRNHAMHSYGDSIPPYPLLVVRPDGIETYGEARKAMRDWDDQFGYELVPADVELAFHRPDTHLKSQIDVAIREAVLKQRARHRIAGGGYGRGRGGFPGGRANGRITIGGQRRAMPTLSAAELDRRGRASGYQPSDDPSYTAGGSYESRSANHNGDVHGNGSGAVAARRLDQHLRSAASELQQDNPRDDSVAGEGDGNKTAANDHATAAETADSAIQPNPYSSVDAEASGSQKQPQSQTGSPVNNPSAGGFNLSSAQASQQRPAEQNDDATADREGGQNTEPGSDTSGQGTVDGGSLADGGSGPVPAASTGASEGMSPTGTQTQPPTPDQSSSQEQASASIRSVTSRGQQDRVRRQGRDWALPDNVAGAHGNAVVRTIRVQCYHDRFVLLPASGDGATEIFGFSDGEIQRATLELATAVRDRVRQWGAAIPGGRWQPRLEVEVMARGETRFHQLRTLMNGSGVEVQGRRSL